MSDPPEHHHNHRHPHGAAAVGTKRQRRPSVRLGDLGGGNLISTYYFDHLLPRQRRQQPLKVRREKIIGVDNESKSKKGLKKENVENVGDLDGGGSWKGRGSASRGGGNENEGDLDGSGSGRGRGAVSRGGKRGGRSSVGSKLVDEKGSGNEDDLDGVAIGSWRSKALGTRGGKMGSNGRRGGKSNVGSELVGEDRNGRREREREDDGDRNFEPICLEEEEDGEENRVDSNPISSFEKDSSDGDGGNEDINGGRGDSDGEKGRNGKDLRFQISDEMDDPSDLSERSGVNLWLKKLGLQRYALNFEIHEVDDEVLPFLTLEDLKDIGITAVGSRRKMFCSIQNLDKKDC